MMPDSMLPKDTEAAESRSQPSCIVGIGASAGGFDAIREFLTPLPPDSGLAFVIIQHLDPTHKSLAASLFAKSTAMPVVEATDGMPIEPDHVYTIPSNRYLSIADAVLHLSTPKEHPGRRLPIDHFFHSLGEDQHERAIAVILSGSGSDGAEGIKNVEANGGIVLVQQPETAQFDGMPNSAIATGRVNYVLPVAKMATVLLDYARHPYAANALPPPARPQDEATVLNTILDYLHSQRRISFRGYRPKTLLRRIYRRMGLRRIASMVEYAALLRKDAGEADELCKDLLIGVTEFFRDPQAWKVLLTEVLRPLVASKAVEEPIRVWVAGTSTGEEAYSLAMLLLEEIRRARKRCPLQVFATDANEEALDIARHGIYPAGITAHLTPPRLRRFFIESGGDHRYRVKPELRDAIIFGAQNVLSDPPFSRLDLVSCRNLLIYLEPEVQKKLIVLFHFALRPDGYLFLGAAETIGKRDDLFAAVSKRWRIYRRLDVATREQLDVRISPSQANTGSRALLGVAHPPPPSPVATIASHLILDRFAPAAVMVNNKYEAVYFSGPTEQFLLQPRGIPTRDLLRLLREGLRSRVRGALREAALTNTTVVVGDARVKRNGSYQTVKLTVTPTAAADQQGRMLLVVFQDQPPATTLAAAEEVETLRVKQLEDELKVTHDDLQSTIERLEISYDDLKTANEEVVSINEELQTSNEELESSKEELQSLNEELNTVNQQLQVKITELETANTDLKNLLTSSDIATVCLDREFRIKWFSPAVRAIVNVIPTDIGRPIADFASVLPDAALIDDARRVLTDLEPRQTELQAEGSHWYLRRLLPYRLEDGEVAGVIVTFVDISELRRMAQEAREARDLAAELEQRVEERTRRLRQLTRKLAVVSDKERKALACDLHDDLGQLLAIAAIKLTAVCDTHPDDPLLRELNTLIEQANRRVRSLTFQLSPPVLYELGLVPALEWLTDEMQQLYGMAVRIEDDGIAKPLDDTVASTLFRAVRELLINVVKHANSAVATVRLRRDRDRLVIVVGDSGHGFDAAHLSDAASKHGFGLAGMRDRLRVIDGDLQLGQSPGDGSRITLTVPLGTANRQPNGDKQHGNPHTSGR